MPHKVYIRENTCLAKLAAYNMKATQLAIVYRNTIHLYRTPKAAFMHNEAWLCHELQHVKQYMQDGTFKFLYTYIYYWIKVGYYRIPYEQEARDNECNLLLLQEFEVQ